MTFKQAFEQMKQGEKVKLPPWDGYWYWDEEKKTIMIKCKSVDSDTKKDLLDIRETHKVEQTLLDILNDEWIIATKRNCPVLGGELDYFGFGIAMIYMKKGFKVKRKSWDNYCLFLNDKNDIMVKAYDREVNKYDFDLEDINSDDWTFA